MEARARPRVHVVLEFATPQADTATVPGCSSDRGPLTAREREIASLVVRGLINGQMAAEPVVSEGIIDNHLQQIRDKLGIHSQAQSTAWCRRRARAIARHGAGSLRAHRQGSGNRT
jgi:DNA-binding NarL/FixJ family response regulator